MSRRESPDAVRRATDAGAMSEARGRRTDGSRPAPTATVGIATYGRPGYLDGVLDSLLAQTRHPDALVLADDEGSDAVRRVVESYRPEFEERGVSVRYVPRVGRDSMPGARNTIINCSGTDVICFLDDDVVCEPGWLESIVTTFEERDVAAVGGPAIRVDEELEPLGEIVRDPENRNRINEYGETVSHVERWIPPTPVETQRLGGANMAFRRDVLLELGGFDPAYELGPAKLEEVDLMARLVRRGDVMVYHPGALVHHFAAPTGGARAAMDRAALEDRYWFARNAVLFKRKNAEHPLWLCLLRLGCRALLPWNLARTAVELRSGDHTPLYQIRGYLDGLVLDGLRSRWT
jgi:GT2 family glycosyltransferase